MLKDKHKYQDIYIEKGQTRHRVLCATRNVTANIEKLNKELKRAG
jgi:hypothetical protein